MKRITGKECFKKWHPKKSKQLPEKRWKLLQDALSSDRGFCVRGNNKELICEGDSGAPAIWKNKKGTVL